jgi:hypothetical protein
MQSEALATRAKNVVHRVQNRQLKMVRRSSARACCSTVARQRVARVALCAATRACSNCQDKTGRYTGQWRWLVSRAWVAKRASRVLGPTTVARRTRNFNARRCASGSCEPLEMGISIRRTRKDTPKSRQPARQKITTRARLVTGGGQAPVTCRYEAD